MSAEKPEQVVLDLERRILSGALQKIEELTGLSLDDQGDRFLLQLGLNLVRLGALEEPLTEVIA